MSKRSRRVKKWMRRWAAAAAPERDRIIRLFNRYRFHVYWNEDRQMGFALEKKATWQFGNLN